MKRLAVSAAVTLLALLVATLPGSAAWEWCQSDPIVRLNGTDVQILVAIPQDYLPHVEGPTHVSIKTPKSTVRELLFTDAGFNGHGEVVRFRNGGGSVKGRDIPVEIHVQVPVAPSWTAAHGSVPVQLTVDADNAGPIVVYGDSAATKVKLWLQGD